MFSQKKIYSVSLTEKMVDEYKQTYPKFSKRIEYLIQQDIENNNKTTDSKHLRQLKRELGETQSKIMEMTNMIDDFKLNKPFLEAKANLIVQEIEKCRNSV